MLKFRDADAEGDTFANIGYNYVQLGASSFLCLGLEEKLLRDTFCLLVMVKV